MKKKIYLITLTMLLCLAAFSSHATTTATPEPINKEVIANMTLEQKQARIEEIKLRVNEIKAMDKSQLTRPERKELRVELRGLKHEANAMGGGGIYLSVGAIIIIILLLILILG